MQLNSDKIHKLLKQKDEWFFFTKVTSSQGSTTNNTPTRQFLFRATKQHPGKTRHDNPNGLSVASILVLMDKCHRIFGNYCSLCVFLQTCDGIFQHDRSRSNLFAHDGKNSIQRIFSEKTYSECPPFFTPFYRTNAD